MFLNKELRIGFLKLKGGHIEEINDSGSLMMGKYF
jgi:hypothetical protein